MAALTTNEAEAEVEAEAKHCKQLTVLRYNFSFTAALRWQPTTHPIKTATSEGKS